LTMPAAPAGIQAIILAAGLSRRMGQQNKLLLPDAAGTPMLATVAAACCASQAEGVIAVLGHQADEVGAMLGRFVADPKLRLVTAPLYRAGLSASLKSGILALPPDTEAALICLGDMPLVSQPILDRIIARYRTGRGVVVPAFRGRRGNPVLWDRRYFPDLLALEGDEGARPLLLTHAADVTLIETDDRGVVTDFDTPGSR
jgi:molybdenum cofactor cytidylyltransferase